MYLFVGQRPWRGREGEGEGEVEGVGEEEGKGERGFDNCKKHLTA